MAMRTATSPGHLPPRAGPRHKGASCTETPRHREASSSLAAGRYAEHLAQCFADRRA